ncbi:MAG TPA: hypothetical protein VMB80_03550 [Candidatus Acidoferrum sp.]|nr:hypothetical protein [Candidatus Acidoferrum sp.]
MATSSFGNICADAVSAPHDLSADRVAGERVPTEHDFPNFVCQFFSQLIDPQILKICPIHYSKYYRVQLFQAPITDYPAPTTLRTTDY